MKKNEHIKKLKVFLVILILTLPKIYLLLMNDICLGWDCPFYLYATEYKIPTYSEPSFFIYLLKPFAHIFGTIPTIKGFMIFINFVFLFGVYILLKELKLEFKHQLLFIAIAGMSVGITRMWADTLRNFFVISLTPYLFYLVSKRKYIVSALLLGIMTISHMYPLLLILVFLFYFYFIKERRLKIYLAFFSIIIFIFVFYYISIGQPEYIKSTTVVWTLKNFSPNPSIILDNFLLLIFFNSGLIALAIGGLFYMKTNNRLSLLLSLMFFMLLIVLPTNVGQWRAASLISFPSIFLAALFFKNQNYKIQKILIIVLIGYIFYGFPYLMSYTQITTKDEIRFLENIDVPNDSLLIVPSRVYFLSMFLTEDKQNIQWAEFYEVLGTQSRNETLSKNAKLYNSSLEESSLVIDEIKQTNDISHFYLYYNDELDVYNDTTIQGLKDIGRYKMIKNTEGIYLYEVR